MTDYEDLPDEERLRVADAVAAGNKARARMLPEEPTVNISVEEYDRLTNRKKLEPTTRAFTMISAVPSDDYPRHPKDALKVLLFDIPHSVAQEFYRLITRRELKTNLVELDFTGMSIKERRTFNDKLRAMKKAGLIKRLGRKRIMISPYHILPPNHVLAQYDWDKLP